MWPFLRRLAGPLTGAVAALVTLAAANALAGSGIGEIFNLGVSNTVNSQTLLSGNAGGNPQLRVLNASTSPAASGVFGKMTSASAGGDSAGLIGVTESSNPAAAGVVGKNNGGGPGLSAIVTNNAAPLKVNSGVKVSLLNSDLVDGLDSSDFAPVGLRFSAPSNTPRTKIATLSGLGDVFASCNVLGDLQLNVQTPFGDTMVHANLLTASTSLYRENDDITPGIAFEILGTTDDNVIGSFVWGSREPLAGQAAFTVTFQAEEDGGHCTVQGSAIPTNT